MTRAMGVRRGVGVMGISSSLGTQEGFPKEMTSWRRLARRQGDCRHRGGWAQGTLGLGEGSAGESEAHSRSCGTGGWTMEEDTW